MASTTELSNTYVRDLAALSPLTATFAGIPGYDDQLDDLSPDGIDARHALALAAAAAIAAAPAGTHAEEVGRQVIAERLGLSLETYNAGYQHGNLNVIDSPVQNIRLAFDLMPTDSSDEWAQICRRMAAVPAALAGYQASLRAGVDRGVVPAVRQIDQCALQCDAYSGAGSDGGYFGTLAGSAEQGSVLSRELGTNAERADASYAELARFLRTQLRPHAPALDAVGEQRYTLSLRDFTGAEMDLAETYSWGWHEFLSIEAELKSVAAALTGGDTPAEAAAALDANPSYQLHGRDALQRWMQDLSDAAVAELGRTYFDVPDPIRVLECRIAPPGGSLGAYYTGPSDDLSRPGRMWWSVEPGREVFSTWRETTVVYHEGVPGHHLQIGTQVCQRERLNDFQRLLGGTSGHAEGWALYAERLVRELGYLEDPALLLGMLNDQLFRAARVVLDIGMHLQYEIPPGTGFHEGRRWTPELGLEFLRTRTVTDPAHARDEIDRYLGWPGQAPAYKVGERVWLEARAAARQRHGDRFDLKRFHTEALNLGGMGLDPLRGLLAEL